MNGTLYLVATPIGNFADMTFRAIEVLKLVDVVVTKSGRKGGACFAISALRSLLKV